MGALHSESSRWSSRFVLIGATLAIALTAASGSSMRHSASPTGQNASAIASISRLPIAFEPNMGQAAREYDFVARGAGYTLLLGSRGPTVNLSRPHGSAPALASQPVAPRRPLPQSDTTLRIGLEGASPSAKTELDGRLPGVSNYYLGNDPSRWFSGIPNFTRAGYRGIYPGIDLVYYGDQGQLEFDFVLAPHASPSAIKLAIDGAQRLELAPGGDLIASVAGGRIALGKPVVYQRAADGTKTPVEGHYVALGSADGGAARSFGIALASYDRERAVVIDPKLNYSTYVGGTVTEGVRLALGSLGNTYITGLAQDCTGCTPFPVTTGVPYAGGSSDVFVTELNATGTAFTYSTLFGGSSFERGEGIAVDAAGNAYVTGITFSTNLPVTVGPAYGGNGDAFVAKFAPTTGALIWATYLGGSQFDRGLGISVIRSCTTNCSPYVTGVTTSSNFPTTAGVVQPAIAGPADAFVTKLKGNGSLGTSGSYSTFLGATFGGSAAIAIAVDSTGAAYVVGVTGASNFPVSTGVTFGGTVDGFVTKFNAGATSHLYSTLLGGSAWDTAQGVALKQGCLSNCAVYVVGATYSSDFPVSVGALQTTRAGVLDAVVTQLDSTGATRTYSTYLGGPDGASVGGAIAVDGAGLAYVVGETTSAAFPTVKPLRLAQEENGASFKSTDGGVTFNSTGLSAGVGSVVSGVVDTSTTPSTLYFGTTRNGLWVSADGGVTFNITALSETPVGAVAADKSKHPSTIYAGTPTGLVMLTDGGQTFAGTTLSGVHVLSIAIDDHVAPSKIVVGTESGAFQSANGGSTFSASTGLPAGTQVLSLTIRKDGTAMAGTDRGVFVSHNSGAAFAATSLNFESVISMTNDNRTTSAAYFAGTLFDGVFRSTDGFNTFTNSPIPLLSPSVFSLDRDATTTPATIYAEVSSGGFAYPLKSTDDGHTFVFPNPSNFNTQPGFITLAAFDSKSHALYISNFREDDPFVTQINTGGTALLFSTYLGGGNIDFGTGIAVNKAGSSIYVQGLTFSNNFPIFPNPGAAQTTYEGFINGFVSRITLP